MTKRHFGRTDIELPWEQTDKANELKATLLVENKKAEIRFFIIFQALLSIH